MPDAVFIGGGLTAPGLLDACWDALPPGGRLVANTVTLESEALLAEWYRRHGGDLVRLAVAHAVPVGGFTGWRQAMPVTQWSVTKPGAGPHPQPSGDDEMTVYFIGAGPGAADLITVRGARVLAACPVCLYAGSLVPRELLAECPPDARLVDTAQLDLDADHRRAGAGARGGPRRGPAALGRPVGLQRGRRADAPARRGGCALRGGARRARVRRGGRRAQAGADGAHGRPDRRSSPGSPSGPPPCPRARTWPPWAAAAR